MTNQNQQNRQSAVTERIFAKLKGKDNARIVCTGYRPGERPFTLNIDLPQGVDQYPAIFQALEEAKVKKVTKIQVHPL